jgi:hypothetical protein
MPNTVRHVETLWIELQNTLDKSAKLLSPDASAALSDYRETSYKDALGLLLREETKNERQHRTGYGSGDYPFSSVIGAKIIIMENIARGAAKVAPLEARLWLEIRRTAAEAMTIGNLLGPALSFKWRAEAQELDYSDLMNPRK